MKLNLRERLINFGVGLLTKPLREYNLKVPNDIENLKRYIRKGDVVLVEGNERISQVIKYLTQSSWSHSALYVGDEPLKRGEKLRRQLIEQFGDDANYLVVEALVESGVTLSPISKYRDFNIRVCRPYNLSREDLRQVMDEAISNVGYTYDVKNVVDLARYFFPVSLVPRRFRRRALHLGSGDSHRVICSSMIAECFHRVKFPIVPNFKELPRSPGPRPFALKRWFAGSNGDGRQFGVLKPVAASMITPRDFDLSPYFEVVKFNIIEDLKFDYRKIMWAEDETPEASHQRPVATEAGAPDKPAASRPAIAKVE